MQRWFLCSLMGWMIWGCPLGRAAVQTEARLQLEAATARPGQTVLAGVHLTMKPGWHTYWQNGGDSGQPTAIEWSLPAGITPGPIQWPVPEKYEDSGLVTYIYHQEVLLLVPLTLATNLAPGPVELKAKVTWLECEKICVPGEARVQAVLTLGNQHQASADVNLFETWKKRLPIKQPGIRVTASWDKVISGDTRELRLDWTTSARLEATDFLPYGNDAFEVQAATGRAQAPGGVIQLRKIVKKLSGSWPGQVRGVLVVAGSPPQESMGYDVTLTVAASAPGGTLAPQAGSSNASTSDVAPPSIAAMLWYAFLGGLILNIMPCVLPVIALKILGFVHQSQAAPARIRRLGLAYALGVLVSFLALALMVIGVKLAGRQAGWGMQFGNPVFVVILTVLVTLVALNLFGLFEVTLSGRVMGVAGELGAKEGMTGAFFNGMLATALATPCTAPFLGVALGFAFSQSASVIVLFFLTVGLGLAFPYVLLSWQPAWLKLLPKPGVWMEQFKIAMGFPMLATAVWLFTLTGRHYGHRLVWLGIFLVVVALAVWVFGTFVQRGRRQRGFAAAVVLLLVATGYGYALESQLRWRQPVPETATAGLLQESPEGIAWRRWSREAVDQARQEGRPVFVDFTADWCLTCQLNKKTSIEVDSVRSRLKAINAVALLGDYTTLPQAMTDELNRFSRAGVPLVLVYPRKTDLPPIVLPEILTPQTVLHALDQAVQ